ncbi:murein transglycosylase A [Sphingomonas daechungensis]|uniref:peptidoglycan lytic exotransglycosylase n=2 Tax=Sphingomonas daechungensis TaxID=1176646 RepID=A0ABX6SYA7_9SPHN|nr:murein transglycosylase A [Sphingomonas daechungensis]QNP42445.1 murein transglycosylase A [Sphingomonas daechungensis]
MTRAARAVALATFIFLSACATRPVPAPTQPAPAPVPRPVPPPAPLAPPPPANAIAAGISLAAAPQFVTQMDASRAFKAFRASCPALLRRQDQSGLTSGAAWAAVCTEASAVAPEAAGAFFRDRFDWISVGGGKAFATGYYEPEIAGSRSPLPGYVPIHGIPRDLTRCTRLDGQTGRGRVDETGTCVLYFTRPEIEDGAIADRAPILAWAADNVDLFFLEIQGSGRVRFPDGTVMRLGYANQNGRDYVAIGRLLRERGILPPGGANMQAIKDWMRANPDQGRQLMRENLSYIFFRELTGPGPLGAMNVPVSPKATVAADPRFVPLGAPVFLAMDRPEAYGFWVAQDTGGAIKGANRFDTFWGAGEDATRIAGGMSANGVAWVLVPKGTVNGATAQP